MLFIFLFLLVGAIAGFMSGFFGIGGGIITVPCLIYLFRFFDIESQELMQMALGTSLAAVVLNTCSAAYIHYRLKNILAQSVKVLIVGSALGAFLGGLFVGIFSAPVLQVVFGLFEIVIGLIFFSQASLEHQQEEKLPKGIPLLLMAFGISFVSSLFGIGGGILMVPLFVYFHVPMKKAIGTATVTSCCTALTASFSYILIGYQSVNQPYSLGFVYLPAFILLGVMGLAFAPLGAKVATSFPSKHLKRGFGLFLFGIGLLIIATTA